MYLSSSILLLPYLTVPKGDKMNTTEIRERDNTGFYNIVAPYEKGDTDGD